MEVEDWAPIPTSLLWLSSGFSLPPLTPAPPSLPVSLSRDSYMAHSLNSSKEVSKVRLLISQKNSEINYEQFAKRRLSLALRSPEWRQILLLQQTQTRITVQPQFLKTPNPRKSGSDGERAQKMVSTVRSITLKTLPPNQPFSNQKEGDEIKNKGMSSELNSWSLRGSVFMFGGQAGP